MRIRSFVRSRWVKIPLLLILLLLVIAGIYLAYKLGTTTPAMYNTVGLAQPEFVTTSNQTSETLVYTSLRPSNWDIYLFDSLDAAPRRLTDHPNLDYNPVLSHDGRWVVFVSERDGNANLYAIDLPASLEPVRLTSYSGMDDAPTLSPDGTKLAFVSTPTETRTSLSCLRRAAQNGQEAAGKLVCHGDGPVDFPSLTEQSDRVFAIQWVHEETGLPPGPSAIVSAQLDGTALQPTVPAGDSAFMWAPTVTHDGAWIFLPRERDSAP